MKSWLRGAAAASAGLLLHCGSEVDRVAGDSGTVGATASGTSTSASTSTSAGVGTGGGSGTGAPTSSGQGGAGAGGTGGGCDSDPDDDQDGDGFTPAQGDCNDCDELVGPNAVEDIFPPEPDGPPAIDDDCNGIIDDPPEACDGGLAIDDADPVSGARAIELCRIATATTWGLVSAAWVMPDGSPAITDAPFASAYHRGHGLLPALGGLVPPAGLRLLSLSSGTARQPTDPDYADVGGFDKGYLSDHPEGLPFATPACPATSAGQGHDGVALELVIRTPSNAIGYTFDYHFLSADWPNGVCTPYDDAFLALMTPPPMGAIAGDVALDSQGNPVSVSNAFFEVCGCANGPPCEAGGKTFDCAEGAGQLDGTGFEGHASTGWQRASVPTEPDDTITLRFTVYDVGDGISDSTVLVDRWRWIADTHYGGSTGNLPPSR